MLFFIFLVLPFDELAMVELFRKIVKAELSYPPWMSTDAISKWPRGGRGSQYVVFGVHNAVVQPLARLRVTLYQSHLCATILQFYNSGIREDSLGQGRRQKRDNRGSHDDMRCPCPTMTPRLHCQCVNSYLTSFVYSFLCRSLVAYPES